ncbi:endoplasmic reticulum resident protein 27 isoform X1 [Alligator sinensis]|uniref:Endoplasmic reticulum resident protein 27 n=1 Tax=Alligator sinensis TaxID=38654 RepID=A0A1U7RUP4_ALLSI|nr:endoplasmic reticulum resident protein 27 isoform X1 [Alligator sinensis]
MSDQERADVSPSQAGTNMEQTARRREGETMASFVLWCLLIFTWGVPSECAEEGPSPHGATGNAKKPVLLNDTETTTAFISAAEVAVVGFFQEPEKPEVLEFHSLVGKIRDVPFGLSTSPEVLSHYNITINTISIFRRVDENRQDLEITDGKEMDATKFSRFIQINELRMVTEYNPVTAIGLFNSTVQIHLLLFTDKTSKEHTERMHKYQEAAELFRGKILFVLVDSNVKGNDRVMSFFKLKKSQLPALAIFHTPDEEQDVLPLGDVSVEHVQDFCNAFLQRKTKKEDPGLEEDAVKVEL